MLSRTRSLRKSKLRKSRSARKTERKSKSRKQRGGNASLEQGADFAKYHVAQHGGFRELGHAPVGYTGELDQNLRESARIAGYDAYFRDAAANGQSGGSRRKSKSKSKKSKAKAKKSKKSKANSKAKKSKAKSKSQKKQRGGFAPIGQASMLLEDYSKAGLPSFKSI